MGKRSDFERNPRDFYRTPVEAVRPLLPHLPERCVFDEPFAGDGALVDALSLFGHRCMVASDIEPQRDNIKKMDALTEFIPIEMTRIITNSPWDRSILHAAIERFRRVTDSWFLFDADWLHNSTVYPRVTWCAKVVSVGRVKWIEDSAFTGKDNCAWYFFPRNHVGDGPTFYGRRPEDVTALSFEDLDL